MGQRFHISLLCGGEVGWPDSAHKVLQVLTFQGLSWPQYSRTDIYCCQFNWGKKSGYRENWSSFQVNRSRLSSIAKLTRSRPQSLRSNTGILGPCSDLTLRSGDILTNDRIGEVELLLVENYSQYPAWRTWNTVHQGNIWKAPPELA